MLPLVVIQIQCDDDRAFMSELYEKHYRLMKDVIVPFKLGHEENDVINDACIKLIYKIPLLKTLSSCVLRSYIAVTIKNTSIDFIRKRDREATHSFLGTERDAKFDLDNAEDDTSVSPEKIAIDNEAIEALSVAMLQLPDIYKNVLEFKYLLDMSDEEIATVFGVSPNSVRMYLTRARRMALKKLMVEGVFDEQ